MKKIIIVIDGFFFCGKSILVKVFVKVLNYGFVDFGVMYWVVILYLLEYKIFI